MKQLAIIGLGPRGFYALENVITELSQQDKEVEILIFENSKEPGAGHVWYEGQPNSNWINITERALTGLRCRPKQHFKNVTIEAFPSYHNWCNFALEPHENDTFPPRKKLGKYLNERFNSIKSETENLDLIKYISAEIQSIIHRNDKLILKSKTESWQCDDVLLTIGHQTTKTSDQIKAWQQHTENNSNLLVFADAYPVNQLESTRNTENITIGIRGFGLAMVDIMRYLVINNYGNFKVVDNSTFKTVYYKTKTQHLKLIPFSLDGLPLAPKPLNENIDNWYKPTKSELEFFKSEIEAITQTDATATHISFIIKPIAKIASRIYNDLNQNAFNHSFSNEELENIISNWLKDADYKHELLQDETISAYNLIEAYVNMALGTATISLDFCVGQVWRHCQPTLYKAFSYAQLDNEIIEDLIALDERSKRYSYGPPIESMQQMLALVDAEVLSLEFLKDPTINMINDGWQLENEDNKTVTCSTMINSVLDAPKLLDITSPLVKNLLKDDLIQPMHSKLGIETSDDAYVITADGKRDIPIAVLGRLAKGSVIGVDAILECFGPRIENWASAYVNKL
ncbi:FAD/NAD(P)-binding protein [uncultured Winogradskyella sp.]|uniref:FAD/NAD(P)-binding protein n=1 Tax=uncultured Winogradskyella sp. TaxID=395353 RepID=UPI00261BC830|nr:FAD/NAD(P)-binding domain-containing protein [uncultured Winogradskyella sp.]